MIVNDYKYIDLELIGLLDQPVERITTAVNSSWKSFDITTNNVGLDILLCIINKISFFHFLFIKTNFIEIHLQG